VFLLNSAPEGPRSRQNPRPIHPQTLQKTHQTLQTDPIRLSSHKGEVLRRVNMWATGLKGISLQAAFRAIPAHERLSPDKGMGFGVNLRFKMADNLT
jgi:hypothetical protein